MTYRKGWRDLPDLPARCPVCDDKRTNAAAIALHNLIAAERGCRSYGLARTPMALTAKPTVREQPPCA